MANANNLLQFDDAIFSANTELAAFIEARKQRWIEQLFVKNQAESAREAEAIITATSCSRPDCTFCSLGKLPTIPQTPNQVGSFLVPDTATPAPFFVTRRGDEIELRARCPSHQNYARWAVSGECKVTGLIDRLCTFTTYISNDQAPFGCLSNLTVLFLNGRVLSPAQNPVLSVLWNADLGLNNGCFYPGQIIATLRM